MPHRNHGSRDRNRDHGKGQGPDSRYYNMPSVSNGPLRDNDSSNASGARTFGYPGQSGHDAFSHDDHYQRGPGRESHRGRAPRNYQRADESITDELIERFTDHPALDATQILLQVEDGEVTLTGEVPERRMKHLAEDIAAEVRGVGELHNRISVDDGRSWLGPPGQAVRSGSNQPGSGFST